MNTAAVSVQKARTLAASFRAHRHAGRGWTQVQDRDLARESQELYFIAQAGSPRMM